jgi:hypothetical protein
MQILIGSSSVQSIHAVVAFTAAENAWWLTGMALIPESPGGITLWTDADMLGSGAVELESLSLLAFAGTAETLLDVPTGPVGERRPFQARLSISARQVAGSLHVGLELPRLAASDKNVASAAWEEVPPDAHVLLVNTHIMGSPEFVQTQHATLYPTAMLVGGLALNVMTPHGIAYFSAGAFAACFPRRCLRVKTKAIQPPKRATTARRACKGPAISLIQVDAIYVHPTSTVIVSLYVSMAILPPSGSGARRRSTISCFPDSVPVRCQPHSPTPASGREMISLVVLSILIPLLLLRSARMLSQSGGWRRDTSPVPGRPRAGSSGELERATRTTNSTVSPCRRGDGGLNAICPSKQRCRIS